MTGLYYVCGNTLSTVFLSRKKVQTIWCIEVSDYMQYDVIMHMFSSFHQVSSLNSGGFVSVTEATWFKNKCLASKTLLGSLVKLYWICLLTSLTWLERSIPLSGHQPSGTHVVLNGILTPVNLLNQIMISKKTAEKAVIVNI